MEFFKYDAVGNTYAVIESRKSAVPPSPEHIRKICDKRVLATDGILFGPLPISSTDNAYGVRIFNPDGSEAEKSGNGIRIMARHMMEMGLVSDNQKFPIETKGGRVEVVVFDAGKLVQVDMGKVSFRRDKIPVEFGPEEVLDQPITLMDGTRFTFSAATIGNPHCVVVVPKATSELAQQYGPQLEMHPFFPNRTNVQFMEILDRNNIKLEIWERGAGYTLSSGSSSSAASAVARRLGLCDLDITVHMPGGKLSIQVSDDYSIRMTGPVTKVAQGIISDEVFIS